MTNNENKTQEARLVLSTPNLSLEIVGSETFVSAQAQVFQSAIIDRLQSGCEDQLTAATTQLPGPPPAPHQPPAATVPFPKVVHIEGDTVQLLKKPPGKSTSEKAVATVLIYLWAKRQKGVDRVPVAVLREECRKAGCLDSPNFVAALRDAREWLIIDDAKGPRTLEGGITLPGEEEARRLLEELSNAE